MLSLSSRFRFWCRARARVAAAPDTRSSLTTLAFALPEIRLDRPAEAVVEQAVESGAGLAKGGGWDAGEGHGVTSGSFAQSGGSPASLSHLQPGAFIWTRI